MQNTETRRNSLELLAPGGFKSTFMERVIEIPLDSIQPNPYQVRKEFPEATIRGLADSIEENGLVQPIIVRRIEGVAPTSPTGTVGEKYEIIAGERRLKAYRFLKKEKVPSIVRECVDGQMRVIALLENLQREDLRPMDEAEALAQIKKESGDTDEKIASIIGKSRSYVTRMMAVAFLPSNMKERLYREDISRRTLMELAMEQDVTKQQELLEMVISKGMTSNQVREKRGNRPNVRVRTLGKSKEKQLTFWQAVKEIEETLEYTIYRGVQLKKRQKNCLEKMGKEFFKQIGAKKFEVKF